jgi:hypothetical protein
MIAHTLFMLYFRHLGIGKLLVGELNELVHVPRMATAAAQGEAVSIPELKIAIVKAPWNFNNQIRYRAAD